MKKTLFTLCLVMAALFCNAQNKEQEGLKTQQEVSLLTQAQKEAETERQIKENEARIKAENEHRDKEEYAKTHGKINDHEWVDLGLSVKWATCNVGANSPEDDGNYYAWGETSTKSSYTDDNSVTYGKNFGDIGGDSQYDAATANWGGDWRLPTKSELEELVNKCTWTCTRTKGCKVTGPNGNSIFLPTEFYLSSTPYEFGYNQYTHVLFVTSYTHSVMCKKRSERSIIRPVAD